MNPGLGEVSAQQTWLDVSQGARAFDSSYDTPLDRVFAAGESTVGWEKAVKRAHSTEATLVPGLFASVLGAHGLQATAAESAGSAALSVVRRDGELTPAPRACGGPDRMIEPDSPAELFVRRPEGWEERLERAAADASAVPAGGALAVDRHHFSALVEQRLCAFPQLTVIREEVGALPEGPLILAAGPAFAQTGKATLKNADGFNPGDVVELFDGKNTAYATIMNTGNPYRAGRGFGGGYNTGCGGGNVSGCDVCTSLICADCCCECMGGDLIRCC